MSENSYVLILIQSLEKKSKILDNIIEMNQEQKKILSEFELDMDAFENNLEDKSQLIEDLVFLDQGFEDVYGRVKEDLISNTEEYAEEVRVMKSLIQEITDKSMQVQVEEQRNKKLATNKFAFEKKKLGEKKVSNRVANEYYKRMAKIDYTDSQMIDKKK